ncbi:DUF4149 domain-containing protein [Sulfurimonas sp. HSL-3221]|uniref:DUF4149 domain-containing protein n=1 Tax=Sulfurimonadaceae TaxID=2771471 RepID=UPI001E5AD27B|nr:DUF4149 domain-containing protein [Sulfurimonas sp. HSL-3221]UFS63428.1 DUF4149 domain-containing protein [Sulfurimonas sp. HSL-3221]
MNTKQWSVTLYLMTVAATLGAVLILGIVVAPVIFHSASILPTELLGRYEEGMLMGEIFRRFGFWAYAMAVIILVFEGNEYRRQRRDKWAIMSALLAVATLLMFAAVYVPKILSMQAEGADATGSEAFASLHSASELDFKLLAVALILLFVRRMQLMFLPSAGKV